MASKNLKIINRLYQLLHSYDLWDKRLTYSSMFYWVTDQWEVNLGLQIPHGLYWLVTLKV